MNERKGESHMSTRQNALVLYYSCSNNTKAIAEYAGKIIKERNWNVKISNLDSCETRKNLNDIDLLIVGVPVQYWEMPDAALRMVRDLPSLQNTNGFVFSTYGKCVCNSVPYNLAKELQAKNINILGGAQIVMPHSAHIDENTRIGNIEISFGKGEPTEGNLRKIESALSDIIDRIENNSVNSFDIERLKILHTRGAFANIMNMIMTTDMKRGVMPNILYDKSKCNQCKKCISICDYQAIDFSDDNLIVIDKKRCKKCYKCIENCNTNSLYTKWDQAISPTRSIQKLAKNNETRIVI